MVEKRDVVHSFIKKVATFDEELSKEVKQIFRQKQLYRKRWSLARARKDLNKAIFVSNGTVRLSSF